jgi:SAM-dependent methyltransferase
VTAWYEQWFGADYLRLYPHRDEADAERAVGLLSRHGIGGAGQRVLDLACGAGRHTRALAARGANVVAFDLSQALLLAARGRGASTLVRGDMRALALRDGAFEAVVNLFTSFGYFDDDAEHAAVIREVARVLRPGGLFAFDFLNAPRVRATLVPRDERRTSREIVVQERRLTPDGRFVEKTIHVGEGRTFMERVRLLERSDLVAMFAAAGLTVRHTFGSWDGTPYADDAERLVLLAQRA